MIKDPLIRRLITGTVLTVLFVAVAVRYFNVRIDVVMGFLLGSFGITYLYCGHTLLVYGSPPV